MLVDLEVFPRRIFVAGSLSFKFGFQNNWEVGISWDELRPCCSSPSCFGCRNRSTIESYFAIYSDGACNHLLIKHYSAARGCCYNFNFDY